MANCRDLESNLTAYVDGECRGLERGEVEAHLEACPTCRSRVATERATHDLLRQRCRDLRGCAPEALRQRCAAQRAAVTTPASRPSVRRPWVPLSLAATLVLVAGLFLLFGLGTSVETYAAQLAADHIKCFQFPPGAPAAGQDALGQQWQSTNGWPLKVAGPSEPEHLELLGLRRCGSTRGRVAHLLYRWRGRPLSVYVLNGRLDPGAGGGEAQQSPQAVRKLGEQEIIWSERGRTYAVVAEAPLADLQHVAQYFRRRIE